MKIMICGKLNKKMKFKLRKLCFCFVCFNFFIVVVKNLLNYCRIHCFTHILNNMFFVRL